MNKAIVGAIISLLVLSAPVLALEQSRWMVDIDASVSGATAIVLGAGSGVFVPDQPCEDCGFAYSVSATGGIVNGDGNIDVNGGGQSLGGGMKVKIGGSGASGDLIFATHDLSVTGCCDGCECPNGYQYDASSQATVAGGEGVHMSIKGGAGEDGAGQKLQASGVAGSVDVSMASTITTEDSEGVVETQSHVMGAYGENVWFKAFGKQGLDAVDCGVNGLFISVMGYRDEGCLPCTPGCGCPQ